MGLLLCIVDDDLAFTYSKAPSYLKDAKAVKLFHDLTNHSFETHIS